MDTSCTLQPFTGIKLQFASLSVGGASVALNRYGYEIISLPNVEDQYHIYLNDRFLDL